ncbi:uncharacterized protein [Amphiura filiformis]|uniref:uncharacterized protein n=1 Tax=Amphiura filiformis TaxID=82378 RepID=UPI003B21B74C
MSCTSDGSEIQWSSECVFLRDLPGKLDFPLLIKIKSGWRGDSDTEVFGVEEVYRLHCEDLQRRVIAVDESANHWSFPLHMSTKFLTPEKQGNGPMYLETLLSQSKKLPSKIQFAPRDDVLMKIEGDYNDNWEPLINGIFKPLEVTRARFFKANKVEQGIVNPGVHILPAYLHIMVQTALGFEHKSDDDWQSHKQSMSRDLESRVNFDMYRGSMDIKVYPSATIRKTRRKSKVDLYEEIIPRTVSIKTLLNQRRQERDTPIESKSDLDQLQKRRHRNAETGETSIREGACTVTEGRSKSELVELSDATKTGAEFQHEQSEREAVISNVVDDADINLGHSDNDQRSFEDPIYDVVERRVKVNDRLDIENNSDIGNCDVIVPPVPVNNAKDNCELDKGPKSSDLQPSQIGKPDKIFQNHQDNKSSKEPVYAAVKKKGRSNDLNTNSVKELRRVQEQDERVLYAVNDGHAKEEIKLTNGQAIQDNKHEGVSSSRHTLLLSSPKQQDQRASFVHSNNKFTSNAPDSTKTAQDCEEEVLYSVNDNQPDESIQATNGHPTDNSNRQCVSSTLNNDHSPPLKQKGQTASFVNSDTTLKSSDSESKEAAQGHEGKDMHTVNDKYADKETKATNGNPTDDGTRQSISIYPNLNSHDLLSSPKQPDQDDNYVQNNDTSTSNDPHVKSTELQENPNLTNHSSEGDDQNYTAEEESSDVLSLDETGVDKVNDIDNDQDVVVIGRSWTPGDPDQNISYF